MIDLSPTDKTKKQSSSFFLLSFFLCSFLFFATGLYLRQTFLVVPFDGSAPLPFKSPRTTDSQSSLSFCNGSLLSFLPFPFIPITLSPPALSLFKPLAFHNRDMAHRASNARVSRVPELITAGDRILQFFNQVGEDIVEGMKAVADTPEQPNKMQEVSCMSESGGGERVRKKERKRDFLARTFFFSVSPFSLPFPHSVTFNRTYAEINVVVLLL